MTAFTRTFFNVALGEIIGRLEEQLPHKLTFVLADGSRMQVCHFEDVADDYILVATADEERTGCDMAVETGRPLDEPEACCGKGACRMRRVAIPYRMILRLELSKAGAEGGRIGYHALPRGGQFPLR